MQKIRSYDLLGNLAIVRFPQDTKEKDKKLYAKNLMEKVKSIQTVLEKQGKIKGRLRKLTLKYLAGVKTTEVLYRENDCVFRFDALKTYFSPRLSNERKEIANEIKKGENVLVMFAGVAPFSIVIAKKSPASKVYSNEINREANKYAKLNVELNKLKERVVLVPGDIKKVAGKLKEEVGSFDVIVMPRPQLKDSFLEQAFALSKKGTRIYYYDFCAEEEVDSIVEMIKKEAEKTGKKIKIRKTKKAGELAPHKIRLRVDFHMLN